MDMGGLDKTGQRFKDRLKELGSKRVVQRDKPRGSFSVTLFSDTHAFNLSILILYAQCVGVVKEGNIKRALVLISGRPCTFSLRTVQFSPKSLI